MTDMEPLFSRYVRVGRHKTHYVECGDGDPTVLIHGGGPGNSGELNWRQAVPALAQRGRVIAVDLLGYGGTDKPADVEYSHKTLVDHVAAFLDVLCLEKVNLVGNSLGAYIAARCAVDEPDRVAKLLLVGSGTIAQAMGLGLSTGTGTRALAEFDGSKEGLRELIKVLMHHPENVTEAQIEQRFRATQQPGAGEAYRNFMRTRLRDDPAYLEWFDLSRRLPDLAIPIKFIWGEHDAVASSSSVQQLKGLLPEAEFEVFNDSGHLAHNDEPTRFNRAATRFLFGH